MPIYDLHDGRFIQEKISVSVADALSQSLNIAVPQNKVWVLLNVCYYPSASETRVISFFVINVNSAQRFPIRVPVSQIANALQPYPMLTEGMEFHLWPGDILYVIRDIATAGSTMTLAIKYIELELPYYSYVEPQRKLVQKRGSRVVQALSGGGGAAFRGGETSEAGGGRGGPESI